MNDELFTELVASVREGSKILHGDAEASRSFTVARCAVDVKAVREKYQLSQDEFAALLGISVNTLRNWEQGRRTPEGPARVLLLVAAKHPDAVWDVVSDAVRCTASEIA
jgi:putative transcriptional regulator